MEKTFNPYALEKVSLTPWYTHLHVIINLLRYGLVQYTFLRWPSKITNVVLTIHGRWISDTLRLVRGGGENRDGYRLDPSPVVTPNILLVYSITPHTYPQCSRKKISVKGWIRNTVLMGSRGERFGVKIADFFRDDNDDDDYLFVYLFTVALLVIWSGKDFREDHLLACSI